MGGCIPVLLKPIDWGLNDVSMQIDDEITEICIDNWIYRETADKNHIECHIYECGFFDDSELEFDFQYDIRYLGDGKLSKYRHDANNEKLM